MHLFLYWKGRVVQREEDKETQGGINLASNDSFPKWPDWARPKPESRNCMWFYHRMARTQVCGPPPIIAFPGSIAGICKDIEIRTQVDNLIWDSGAASALLCWTKMLSHMKHFWAIGWQNAVNGSGVNNFPPSFRTAHHVARANRKSSALQDLTVAKASGERLGCTKTQLVLKLWMMLTWRRISLRSIKSHP